MGRTRRKKKHGQHAKAGVDGEEGKKVPKTFVVERGKVGHVLSQLVLDLRHIMEPHTASKLKAQHKNVLKDFVMVAGPLGVTHLLLLSRSDKFVNLKVCCLPRGPTVTFHVKSFCLAREVLSSLKKPSLNPTQFLTPPMLALSNLSGTDTCSKLLATMFQNMLPAINVHSVDLVSIRRCLLLHSDPTSNLIHLRHYGIRVVARGTSKGVKKLSSRSHLPNLGQLGDISEFLLGGYASESDGEEMGGEDEVTLPQDLPGRGNVKAGQSTVRLSELGPRLSLELVKIEAGLCGGEVLYHAFVQRSRREARKMNLSKQKERRLKEKRRREQEGNVARKKQEKEEHRVKSLAGMGVEKDEEEGVVGEEDEDVEWFRKEVGEDPDPDMFPGMGARLKTRSGGPAKRKHSAGTSSQAKRHKESQMTSTKATRGKGPVRGSKAGLRGRGLARPARGSKVGGRGKTRRTN